MGRIDIDTTGERFMPRAGAATDAPMSGRATELLRIVPFAAWLAGALAAVSALFAAAASAEAPAAAAAAGQAVPSGGVTQMVLGLLAVLAMIGAIAWLLRRYSGLRGAGSGLIRIVGGAAVGQRERIVLVEVGGTWLLVGVAPGQVRALHTMPKAESAAAPEAPTPPDQGFAGWLQRLSEKRSHD